MIDLLESDAPLPPLAVAVEPGGPCYCGRGETVGTCTWTSSRLWFRAFHEGPPAHHFQNSEGWLCIDCVADAVLAVASGEVDELMRRMVEARRKAILRAATVTDPT